MTLTLLGHIDLPQPGGFDHAAVHAASDRLFVAHTATDSVDVIDCAAGRFLFSIPNLRGVAGALVSDALVSGEQDWVFTSNRGEDTVSLFRPQAPDQRVKVPVGVRPNGLAYAARHHRLLAANVGDPAQPGSHTVSLVDVTQPALVAAIPVPGRTRWTIYHPGQDVFFVNIADPPQIVVVEPATARLARAIPIPAAGPHGLDLDIATERLFCACDDARLIVLDARTGEVLAERPLAGAPDVIFFNAALRHLYVAIGDPGLIEVFDTDSLERLQSMPTEAGAHTLAFDAGRNQVYAFLPDSHRAAVYQDGR